MALVNIETALREAKRHLKNCQIGGGIEILSYKRNRTIALTKGTNQIIYVKENGYEKIEWKGELETISKKLKTAMKREFPRSRKLRLFKFDDPIQLERIHQKI